MHETPFEYVHLHQNILVYQALIKWPYTIHQKEIEPP